MFYSTRRGQGLLDKTFHLSPNENICTIAQMKIIHYLFYLTLKIFFVILNACHNLNILENASLFKSCRFRSKVTAVYHFMLNYTIAQFYLTMMSHALNGSIYLISCDPVSSNQMTTIYIGVL